MNQSLFLKSLKIVSIRHSTRTQLFQQVWNIILFKTCFPNIPNREAERYLCFLALPETSYQYCGKWDTSLGTRKVYLPRTILLPTLSSRSDNRQTIHILICYFSSFKRYNRRRILVRSAKFAWIITTDLSSFSYRQFYCSRKRMFTMRYNLELPFS